MLDGFGLAPVRLDLDLDSYEGDWTHVARFRGRTGWLAVAEAHLQSGRNEWTTTLVVACDEWGEPVPAFMAPNLLACDCSHPKPCDEYPPDSLDNILNKERGELKRRWLRENNKTLKVLDANIALSIEILEAEAKRRMASRDLAIADLRRSRRDVTATFDQRAILAERIQELEDEQDMISNELVRQRADLRLAVVKKERDLLRKFEIRVQVDPLYYVQWRGCSSVDGRGIELESLLRSVRNTTSFTISSARRGRPDQADVDLAAELSSLQLQLIPKLTARQSSAASKLNGHAGLITKVGVQPVSPLPLKPARAVTRIAPKLPVPLARGASKRRVADVTRREAADIWQQSSRLVSKLRRGGELQGESLERLVERHRDVHRLAERLLGRTEGALPLVLIEAVQNLNAAVDLFADRGFATSNEQS